MDDADIATRAAWPHYAGGMTQSAIAERFGIPVTRAHRMIARAAKNGLMRVFVDASVAGCIALEKRLTARFGLKACTVASDLGETGPMPLRALGLAGATLLLAILERGAHRAIGVGHGSTMAAMVEALPACAAPGVQFVSMLGGLTRRFAATPYDVIQKLAKKTGAEAFLMPAPMFANSLADKQVLLAQPGLAEIMRTIDAATVCILGIGAVDMEGGIARANVVDAETSLRAARGPRCWGSFSTPPAR